MVSSDVAFVELSDSTRTNASQGCPTTDLLLRVASSKPRDLVYKIDRTGTATSYEIREIISDY